MVPKENRGSRALSQWLFRVNLIRNSGRMLPRDKLSLSQWEVVSTPANQPGTQWE